MFQEAVDLVLGFIGVQPEDTGCSSVELSEFLLRDVSPYCGQAGNMTFRDTVMLLLLSGHSDQIRVYEMPPASQPLTQSRQPGSRGSKANHKTPPSRGASTTFLTVVRSQMTQAKKLEASGVIRFLETGGVHWDAEHTASSAMKHTVVLRFVPEPSLRERILGFPLHTETMRMTARFICDNAVQGWTAMRNTPETRNRYKSHLIIGGLRKLRQHHVVSMSFVVETTPKMWVSNRWFPTFAAPLTETEKTACTTGDEAVATTAMSPSSTWAASGAEASISSAGLAPSEFAAYRGKRGNVPIHHYMARKRKEDAAFPPLVLDLGVVKRVVRSSPDGSLLYQDAIHAILTAHFIYGIDLPKRGDAAMRRVMEAAGLRVVRASINVRGRPRAIKLVMPVDELLRHIQQRRAKEEQESRKHNAQEEFDEGEEEEERHARSSADTSNIDWEDVEEGAGAGRTSSSDGEGNSDDEEGNDEKKTSGTNTVSGLVNAKSAGKQAAFAPFYMCPDFPIELQLGDEAERRPLALSAVYPKMLFETPEKLRRGLLSHAIETYMRTHKTIEAHSIVERGKKAFSTVYALKEGAVPVDRRLSGGPKKEGRQEQLPVAKVGKDEKDNDAEKREAGSLPKGLSPYAVDTVLGVLESAPRHAATMNRLGTVLDFTTLTRRLLPYLRSIGKVTSTGFTPRGKRRIGIVTLADVVLTEQDKVDLVEEEKAEAAVAAAAANTPEASAAQDLVFGPANARPSQVPKMEIVLDEIPAMTEGIEPSKQTQRLITVSNRARSTVTKLTLIRNGYARQSLCRAGRLHLELWKQWHEQAETLREDGLPVSPPEAARLSLQSVYDNMTLSTFCIVVGFSAFDLASVLGTGSDSAAPSTATDTEERSSQPAKADRKQTRITDFFGATAAAKSAAAGSRTGRASSGVSWLTPLRSLPPSVREWCNRQGDQSLRLALQVLQRRKLIVCDTFIDPFLDTPLASLSISLCSVCSRANHSYTLYVEGAGLAAPYTPSSTAYGVLRYWQPVWSSLSFSQTGRTVPPELLEVDRNMSFPRLAAVARIIRKEAGALAEFIYQCCGWKRTQRSLRVLSLYGRTSSVSLLGNNRRSSSLEPARTWATTRQQQQQQRQQRQRRNGDLPRASSHGGGRSRRARETPRVNITGATVEGALAEALAQVNPRRKVEGVINALDRLRRKTWSQQPLGAPARFLRQIGSKRRGDDTWLFSLDADTAWLGCLDTTSHSAPVSDATVLAVLGQNEYDRNTSSIGTLHSGILACVFKEILMAQGKLPSSKCGSLAFGSKSAVDQLISLLRTTFSPNTLLVLSLDPDGGGRNAASKQNHTAAVAAASSTSSSAQFLTAISASAQNTAGSTLAERAAAQQCRREEARSRSFDLALECLRMVLLSDNAHYRGDTARDLLLAFPRDIVTSARAHLQRCATFRACGGRGRIPELSLSTRPFIFPQGALKSVPRRCANAALLHSWAATLDATATASSRGLQRPLLSPAAVNPFATVAEAPFDVSVVEQPTMNVQGIVDASAELNALRTEQSGMQRAAGAEAALRRTIEGSMRALRLPVLAWPQRSFALESTQLAAARAEEVQRSSAARKRGRARAGDGNGPPSLQDVGEDDDDEDEDADENDGGGGSSGGLKGAANAGSTATVLYPSRALALYDDDLGLLEGVPVTPPPTAHEREMVQRAIADLSAAHAVEDGMLRREWRCGWRPTYPSVFHHVDGTFNEYVWRYTLLCVYQFLLRVPGIANSELRARVTASGLIGPHSYEAVVAFLCDSGVISKSTGAVQTTTVYSRCPLVPQRPPRQRPRVELQRDVVDEASSPLLMEEQEVYYTATVCSSGLWDIMRL